CSCLVDQADGHAVIGVEATAVLMKGAIEGRRELREHERQVVLAAGAVPGPGARAIYIRDIVGVEVESGCVVTFPDRIEYGLGAIEVRMIGHLSLRGVCVLAGDLETAVQQVRGTWHLVSFECNHMMCRGWPVR